MVDVVVDWVFHPQPPGLPHRAVHLVSRREMEKEIEEGEAGGGEGEGEKKTQLSYLESTRER